MPQYQSSIDMMVDHIIRNAKLHNQRTGQYLFNNLPTVCSGHVVGTSFDPFHKDLTKNEIYEWIDYHLIFDGNQIVGLFHNECILWSVS